jgi:hypothetical protein
LVRNLEVSFAIGLVQTALINQSINPDGRPQMKKSFKFPASILRLRICVLNEKRFFEIGNFPATALWLAVSLILGSLTGTVLADQST